MDQTDLFTTVRVDLPGEPELARRFQEFNSYHFGGTLPRAKIRWSSRMRIAGSCDYARRIITLSRDYHEQFPDEIDDTLKHEMIHLVHHRHDAQFRAEAERIGASVHCREYPGLRPRARYVYICPNCQTLFPRAKKDRLYCGRCSRHRWDSRYELILQPSSIYRAARGRRTRRSPRLSLPRRRTQLAVSDLFAQS